MTAREMTPDEPTADAPFDEQPTLRDENPGAPDVTPRSTGGTALPAAGSHIMGTIGDFEVVDKLGQGGMGAVYRARQISLGRMVALKILPAQFEEDEDFVGRFQREARLAASLAHPNLVRVYSSGLAEGSHYIAMELVEGETLSRRVKRGALPPAEAVRICLAVARALQCGWQSGQLIHRDIKPSNIYLSHHGEVKLGDLGLAKSLAGNTTGLTHTGTMMGTPHYISPEQARGDKAVDFRADIYSLGCTLYQCLTGQTPYVGTDPLTVMNLHLSGPPPALLKVMPGCPIPLARLVGKMLKKQRHERHQSYEELIEQLESVLVSLEAGPIDTGAEARLAMWREVGGGASATPPPTPARPAPAAAGKSRLPLYAGLAVGVMALGAAAFFLRPKGGKPGTPPPVVRPTPAVSGAASTPAPAKAESVPTLPAAEPWQDLLRDPARLKLISGARLTPEGLLLSNLDVATSTESRNDGAVRARTVFGNAPAKVVARANKVGHYQLSATPGKSVMLSRWEHVGQSVLLAEFPTAKPLQAGEEYELELRVVGPLLTAKLNGVLLGTATDATFPKGGFGVSVTAKDPNPTLVKSLEVLDLDAPSAASAKPAAAEPWQDAMLDPDFSSKATRTANGILVDSARLGSGPQRDGAMRIRAAFPGNNVAERLRIVARKGPPQGSPWYQAYVIPEGDGVGVERFDGSTQFIPVGYHTRRRLAKPLQVGEMFELEFRVVGQTITVKLNSQTMSTFDDASIPEGVFALLTEGKPQLVQSVEYLNLDGLPEADARKLVDSTTTAATAAIAWQPLRSPTEWQAIKTDKMEFRDGLLHLRNVGLFTKPHQAAADGAVRAKVRIMAATTYFSIFGRTNAQGDQYKLVLGKSGTASLERGDAAYKSHNLAKAQIPRTLREGDVASLELRIRGSRLTGLVDGEVLFDHEDDTVRGAGGWGIHASNGAYESAEVQLGPPTQPSMPTPATATKDAPFVNSLGMKFVPVPITGGPTDGQRVLFSIWETRVEDFDTFAKETQTQWAKSGWQDGTHPAVGMSFDEAEAFCAWLTRREQQAGRLSTAEAYRLPSDHEWSCAVGIGSQEHPAKLSRDKDGKIEGHYPWGTVWPPPPGAGNYNGEESRATDQSSRQAILTGYRDGFAQTAPVGSFPPNGLGLFDLGGNAAERCSDPRDKERSVSRGGAFFFSAQRSLQSSARAGFLRAYRADAHGFRVALAPVP